MKLQIPDFWAGTSSGTSTPGPSSPCLTMGSWAAPSTRWSDAGWASSATSRWPCTSCATPRPLFVVRVVSRSDSALLLSELRVVLYYLLPSLPLDSPRRPALAAPGAKSHLGILLVTLQPYSRGISTAQIRSSIIIGKRALNRPIATLSPHAMMRELFCCSSQPLCLLACLIH